MKRVAGAFAAAVLFATASSASAASWVVGSGETAWRTTYTLSVSSRGGDRCLAYNDERGGGSGCPVERPATGLQVSENAGCVEHHLALYGTISPEVARVQVRLAGGRLIVADRFDPVPQVDPQIAYWAATVRGLPTVRSVTAVRADGTVIARDRDFDAAPCETPHAYRGRRFTVGEAFDPALGTRWRLDAYRGIDEEDGRRRKALCLGLVVRRPGMRHSEPDASACGVTMERRAKALTETAAVDGCGGQQRIALFGLARREVARIVLRSTRGWTVEVPKRAPAWLHAQGRLWFIDAGFPPSGATLLAQDRHGRTIGSDKFKLPKVKPPPDAPSGIDFSCSGWIFNGFI